jgi:hypothetical protein
VRQLTKRQFPTLILKLEQLPLNLDALFAINGALGSVIDSLRLGGSALLSSFWNQVTVRGFVQAVLGVDAIMEMLGWRSFQIFVFGRQLTL